MVRFRELSIGITVVLCAVAGLSAQPKVPITDKPASVPTVSITPGLPGEGVVTVSPGPEPWYTVFGTGEVVGFIEPCG